VVPAPAPRLVNGHEFEGAVLTEQVGRALNGRVPGRRFKHRTKTNWIKMYDRRGMILRVETVINQPEDFLVRRRVRRRADTAEPHRSDLSAEHNGDNPTGVIRLGPSVVRRLSYPCIRLPPSSVLCRTELDRGR
jgi:hypothetical protein